MWSSRVVAEDSSESGVLKRLVTAERDLHDPTKIRERGRFRRGIDLRWWRPSWKVWLLLVVVFAVAGVVGGLFGERTEPSDWAKLALTIVVPVFVLGVSISTLTRTFSESGRFASEYLHEACRMEQFWLVTFGSLVIALVSNAALDFPEWLGSIRSGLALGSFGGAVGSVYMLGFVMLETIRCSNPRGGVWAAASYAARKLAQALLRSMYLGVYNTVHKEVLQTWCKDKAKAIHAPDEYLGHVYRASTDGTEEGIREEEVELAFGFNISEGYMGFELNGLAKLDKYLGKNEAELFMAPHGVAGAKATLGMLRAPSSSFDGIHERVIKLGRKCCRFEKDRLQEVKEEFWEDLFNELERTLHKGVKNQDIGEINIYLEAVGKPFGVLREFWRQPAIREAGIEAYRRCYRIIRLYESTLRFATSKGCDDERFSVQVMRKLQERIWDEVKSAFVEGDCATVKLFTLAIPGLYRTACESCKKEEGGIWEEAARFGDFYAFTRGLFDEANMDEGTEREMRKVLHDGLSKWLMLALATGDSQLVGPLCRAAKEVVFGEKGLKFETTDLMSQHFVLAGKLISMAASAEGVKSEDLRELFFDRFDSIRQVDFNALVDFYLENRFPLKTVREYTRTLYPIKETRVDRLTGSRGGSGFGTTGAYEMALAFVYLSGFAWRFLKVEDVEVRPEELERDVRSALDKLKDKNICRKVYKNIFPNMFKSMEEWLRRCTEVYESRRKVAVERAALDEGKVDRFVEEFRCGYKDTTPFLSYCVKNGYRWVDNDARQPVRYSLSKMLFAQGQPDMAHRLGIDEGGWVGRASDRELLRQVCGISDSGEESKEGDDEIVARVTKERAGIIARAAREGGRWLEDRKCGGKDGILVLVGRVHPEAVFLNDEEFTPAWEERDEVVGFAGSYRGASVVWLWGREVQPYWVALDLRNWEGVGVREEVIRDGTYCSIRVREINEKKLREAVAKGQDESRMKQVCVVDGELLWRLKDGSKPAQRRFPADSEPSNRGTERVT